ncbi:hypothetical protein M407DRAFT_229483 [Tulasnella calospora MUT 4182]|uniref:F-box domain-containing protein n=1 Tax=Tulasnella calospora MUT 4182 TaxID=1051891 RepID=A0A0C3L6A6_9AGAM|nr:hypothetical protein M407DRAFT_229483 [Tulasnella calospora MUT 4182]
MPVSDARGAQGLPNGACIEQPGIKFVVKMTRECYSVTEIKESRAIALKRVLRSLGISSFVAGHQTIRATPNRSRQLVATAAFTIGAAYCVKSAQVLTPAEGMTPPMESGLISTAGQPFLNIDTDVLLLIVSCLEVRDIIALRQICRDLSQRCLDHSVWSTIVMNSIISKNLPWPSSAWPLSEVPAVTLEQLCVRAVQMETKWDTERLKKNSKLFRCIQRPWNSITWMVMLRSRWLLVQLNARRLELWDIESPFTSYPVSYFDGLDGMVDGYKLLETPGESVTIALSVRSYKTYHISIVLPQMGVLAAQTPQFELLNTVAGCSGLLDVEKDLAVFSRSSSNDGAIARCQKSAVFAVLESESEDPKLAYAVGVKTTGRFVIVVRRTAIELYSVDAIHRALQLPRRTPNSIDEVLPTQCIPFRGLEHAVRATFLSRPLHCVDLPYHGTDAIYIGIDRDEKSSRTIRVLYPDTPDGAAGRKFTLSQPLVLLDIESWIGKDSTVLCMWGETGRRMVHVGDVGELCVTGLSIPVGFENERFVVPVEKREQRECALWDWDQVAFGSRIHSMGRD